MFCETEHEGKSRVTVSVGAAPLLLILRPYDLE
jgi:hypothetical protein